MTRVVSIVPSLTEAVAVTAPDLLVGVTDWCTHPPGLPPAGELARIGGTKNPDVAAIARMRYAPHEIRRLEPVDGVGDARRVNLKARAGLRHRERARARERQQRQQFVSGEREP